MSSQTVRNILLRASIDDDFLHDMLNKPESALAEYDAELTVEEREGLLEKSPALLQLAASSRDNSYTPNFPDLWIFLKFNLADPTTYIRLETLVAERTKQAITQLNDTAESLASLKSLDVAEREQYVAEILSKWEQPSVQ